MVRKLIGVFNRKMTEKELEKLQGLCKDMNITAVEDDEYEPVLWWLNETDLLPSDIEPSLYQFHEGRYMELLFMFEAKLVVAYALDEDALEKLDDLKRCIDTLTCIDDMIFSVREEMDAHESHMEEFLESEASLQSHRAFIIFYEHFHSDREQICEAAQEIFEANRYKFENSIGNQALPTSDRSSVVD